MLEVAPSILALNSEDVSDSAHRDWPAPAGGTVHMLVRVWNFDQGIGIVYGCHIKPGCWLVLVVETPAAGHMFALVLNSIDEHARMILSDH
jgi:hypothetical protein